MEEPAVQRCHAQLLNKSFQLVRGQIAWVQALRLRLKDVRETEEWNSEVGAYLDESDYKEIMQRSNRVTAIAMHQGNGISYRLLKE